MHGNLSSLRFNDVNYHFLILANPKSGSRKAKKFIDENRNNMGGDVVITEDKIHCMVEVFDLTKQRKDIINAIICAIESKFVKPMFVSEN